MAAEILAGTGFVLADSLGRRTKPCLEKLSMQELIFPHYWNVKTNTHMSGLSSPDVSISPIASEGTLSDFMHTDTSPTVSPTSRERVCRKRPKSDETEEDRKERQAAKNRQTAKAFRNKMDGMKAYAEMRVSTLKIWVRGLMELVISERRLTGDKHQPRGVRRTCSAPAGSLSATD